jgi:cytochrome P450
MLALLATGLVLVLGFAVLYQKLLKKKYIEGIPVVKEQSLFWGLAKTVLPITGALDSHHRLNEIVHKYGPICQFYVLWRHIVHITDGKLVKQVYENARDKGAYSRRSRIPRVKNLFAIHTSEEWKIRRQKFRHAFTQNSLKAYNGLMTQQVSQILEKLNSAAEKQEVIKIDALFSRFALDSIFRMGFEMDFDFLNHEDLFHEINNAIQTFFRLTWLGNIPFFRYIQMLPFPLPGALEEYRQAFGRLKKLRQDVLRHLREKHAKQSFQSECFGKLLMEFVDEHQANLKVTETDIESEVMIFIIAGHETTGHSLSFFTYTLCKYPEVQMKCKNALRDHLFQQKQKEEGGSTPQSFSIFSPLPEYIEASMKETMRLYPVNARGSLRINIDTPNLELKINNGKTTVQIPESAIIHLNVFSMQRSKENWGETANEFLPERWLDSGNLQSPAAYAGVGKKGDEISFAPFSFGIRNCVGMNFALWEMRSVIFALLQQFSFEIDPNEKNVLLDEEQALLTDMLTMKLLHQLPVKIAKAPLFPEN